jgi:PAS domain S-box-containing protein
MDLGENNTLDPRPPETPGKREATSYRAGVDDVSEGMEREQTGFVASVSRALATAMRSATRGRKRSTGKNRRLLTGQQAVHDEPESVATAILERIDDAFYALDPELRFTYVNRKAERLWGRRREELLGAHVWEVFPQAVGSVVYEEIERAAKEGVSTEFEALSPVVGTWVSGRVYSSPEGLSVYFRDIEKQKKAEEAVQRAERKYRGLFENALEGIFQTTLDGRLLTANPALARMFGYDSPEDALANTTNIAEYYADPDLREELTDRLRSEGSVLGFEAQGRRRDGGTFWCSINAHVVRDGDGEVVGFEGKVEDITERKEVERALAESERRFRTLVSNLPGAVYRCAPRPPWTIEYISDHIEEISGHPAREFTGDGARSYESVVHPEDRERVEREALRALRRREHFSLQYRLVHRSGEIRRVIDRGSGAFSDDGEPLYLDGVIYDVTSLKQAEKDRDLALGQERAARERAQKLQCRYEFLAETSRRLAGSLDYEDTLASVARLAVPHLGHWCFVDVVGEDGAVERVAAAHADHGPAAERLALKVKKRYPLDPEAPHGTSKVIRTGTPEMLPDIDGSKLADIARDAEALEVLKSLAPRSCICAPLAVRGRTLGAITFVSREPGRYGQEDLNLVVNLAQRAAQAIENARLYREKSRTARVLQRSLLPPELPEVPGIEVDARYAPAGEGNEVGGDFYDLFNTAASGWAFVIGDVCGKGPEAAELTALARYTIRTAAMQEKAPSRILSTLNEAILRQRNDKRFCTAAYGLLEPAEKGARFTVCCGGHPQPLILRADGSVEPACEHGLVLGVFPDPQLSDQVFELDPGDTLVLYTDGVLEARRPDGELFGEERLSELLSSCEGLGASTVAEKIERAVMDFQQGRAHDDLALLVLRVRG